MHGFKFWIVILFLTLLGSTKAYCAERYALLVGANDGGRGRPELRYATQDAANLAHVLQKFGQFAPESIQTLVQPTRKEFYEKLDDLAQNLGKVSRDNEFVFYYSGHANEQGLLLKNELIPYEKLRQKIKELPAKVKILIIDACSSGALAYSKGGTHESPFLSRQAFETSGFAIVTSSSVDEASQESERLRGSFFTHFLLAGLRGAADTNSDRIITLNEAYQFAYKETLHTTSKTQLGAQHPSYDFQLKGRGDFVFTDLRNLQSAIDFPVDTEGLYYIRSKSGHLFLELQKKKGIPEILAVEPGSYEIVRYAGERYLRAFFELKENQRLSVDKIVMQSVPAEKVATRGDHEFPEFLQKKFFHISLWPERPLWNHGGVEDQELTVHLSPLIGTAHRINGLGFGLLAHLSHDVRGVSASPGFNYNQRTLAGVQASLGVNVSEDIYGLQLAPINSAYQVYGAQLGIFNSGGLVTGLQFGYINLAARSEGLQLGLFNFAEYSRGLSIAPIMIVKNGIVRADIWTDNLGLVQAGLRSGTPYYYSSFFFGVNSHLAMLGVGPGVRLPIEQSALALDISWSFYQSRIPSAPIVNSQGKLVTVSDEKATQTVRRVRVYYEWPVTEFWHAFAGVSETRQHYGGSNQKRLKIFAPLAFGGYQDSEHERRQLGFMLGVSFSLLETYL